MISKEKLLEILKGLQVKHAKGQVRWNVSETSERVSEFWLAFPSSTLYLRYDSPVAEFDAIEIEIQNEDDLIVAFARIEEEDEAWPSVKAIYDEIEGPLLGSDRILEEIEGAIRSGEQIGIEYT